MNDNVVKIDDHRPHQATYVACLACKKIGSDKLSMSQL
jgi:hypothetical protein